MLSPIAPIKECWRWFGPADLTQDNVVEIQTLLSRAVYRGYERVHFLFQSRGGEFESGFRLYNFFKNYSPELFLYNNGYVGSAAAIAFLGAAQRRTSRYSAFMFHTPFYPALQNQRAEQLAENAVEMEEAAAQWGTLIEEHLPNLSTNQKDLFAKGKNVNIYAQEAISLGLAEEGEFQIPLSNYNDNDPNGFDFGLPAKK